MMNAHNFGYDLLNIQAATEKIQAHAKGWYTRKQARFPISFPTPKYINMILKMIAFPPPELRRS
jgi:hypothetical protein